MVAAVMAVHQNTAGPTLDDIIKMDRWARDKTLELFNQDKIC
jgi:hypothetical protein